LASVIATLVVMDRSSSRYELKEQISTFSSIFIHVKYSSKPQSVRISYLNKGRSPILITQWLTLG